MASGQTQDDAKEQRLRGTDSLFGLYADTQQLTALGSDITDAAPITVKSGGLVVVSGANGTLGVRLPQPQQDGHIVFLKGITNGVLKVWPHGATAINALTGAAAMSLASGLIPAIFIWNETTSKWYTFPLLPS